MLKQRRGIPASFLRVMLVKEKVQGSIKGLFKINGGLYVFSATISSKITLKLRAFFSSIMCRSEKCPSTSASNG